MSGSGKDVSGVVGISQDEVGAGTFPDINLTPPPLYAPGVREEHLLDYTVFPPMNAPALQGPLRERKLSQFVFSPTFLALKLASLPSTSCTQQWRRFEFVCRAVAAYQEHVVVVPSGCIHTFTADIWSVGDECDHSASWGLV